MRAPAVPRSIRWPMIGFALLAACGSAGPTPEDHAESLVRAALGAHSSSFRQVTAHEVVVGADERSTVVCGQVIADDRPARRFIVGAGAALIEDGAGGQAAFETTWRTSCGR